ncbi:MAG: hypothetical protein ACHQFZ_08570 [Acidimicrobiales bacterium]
MARERVARDTVSAYGVECVLAALAYYALQTVIVASPRPSTSLREELGRDLTGRHSVAACLVAVPLALVWRWGGIIIFVGVAVTWLVPDRRVEHYLDHHAATV